MPSSKKTHRNRADKISFRPLYSRPSESRLSNTDLKKKVQYFYEDIQKKREEAAEKKTASKAARRHAVGNKFFEKHFDPSSEWVKNHPLPPAKDLFSNIRPSSTRNGTLSELVRAAYVPEVSLVCSNDNQVESELDTAGAAGGSHSIDTIVTPLIKNEQQEIEDNQSTSLRRVQSSENIENFPTSYTTSASNESPSSSQAGSEVKSREENQPFSTSLILDTITTAPRTETQKLTRTQKRKQKYREFYAANPEATKLSRKEQKSVNKLVNEIRAIIKKHTPKKND